MPTTTDLLAAAQTAAPYHGIALNGAYRPSERLQSALKALDLLTTVIDGMEAESEQRGVVVVTGPVHLLTGDLPYIELTEGQPGGRLLVHVWADGTGEVAWRATDQGSDRWGPPSRLEPAP